MDLGKLPVRVFTPEELREEERIGTGEEVRRKRGRGGGEGGRGGGGEGGGGRVRGEEKVEVEEEEDKWGRRWLTSPVRPRPNPCVSDRIAVT